MAHQPDVDAYTRALLGVLVRARAQFDIDALASMLPGLTYQQRMAALAQEAEYALAWEAKARDRIRKRLEADTSLQTSMAMLPAERNILAGHIAMTGMRMVARADIAVLRATGETHGYWMRSDRPWEQSCKECQTKSGRLWPLDYLERHGPPRHPHCGCKVISHAAAKAWGLPMGDPIALREALAESCSTEMFTTDDAYQHLVRSTGGVLQEVGRLETYARGDGGLSAAAAERLSLVLREAMVPVWRESDHPRWPRGHPLGGQFRLKRVDVGEVPAALAASYKAMMRAAVDANASGVERAYSQMVKKAKQMYSPQREESLRLATRARASVFNPTGRRIKTGETIKDLDGRELPIPLGIPQLGQAGGWAATGPDTATFMWEIPPDSLGPDHPGLITAMKGMAVIGATENRDGTVRLQSSPRRTASQANSDARRLEIMVPQLRAMRVVSAGVDLADSAPIDPDENEVATIVGGEATWYPGISTRMLGDTAENLIDAVAMRMWELGIYNKGEPIEFPSLQSPDRNSPLDWVIGTRGIDVKAQSMRSVYPAAQQRADTVDDEHRPDKIAAVTRRGLQPTIMHAYTDLDNDVAHVFMHDYPDTATVFKEIRPPMALVDRLTAGTLRPGEWETATTGPDAGRGEKRWVFLGTFRLAYNPYFARLDEKPAALPGESESGALARHLQASRMRAAKKAPLDIGPRGALEKPMDVVTSAQATEEAIVDRMAARVARDERIEALARMDVRQEDIANEVGLTQARVSQILSDRRKLDPTVPVPSKGRKDRPGISDAVRRAKAPPMRQHGGIPGERPSGGAGTLFHAQVTPGALTQRQRLAREAKTHAAAGLKPDQIARKMGLLLPYVLGLLDDPDPT